MSDAQLRIEIQAVADQATSEISRLEQQLNSLNNTTSGVAIGEQFQRVGGQMTAVGQNIVSTMMGVGGSMIGVAGNFESSLNNVRAITGATGEDFDKLREQAKNLGATTAFSASQAADGMAFLGMAGFKTNEVLEAMPQVLALASAGSLDLAKASDIASNIMGGFQLKASDMGKITDVLAQTARSANTDILQLGEAFSYAAPVAQSFGMEIEEASAIIGKLSDVGIQGSRAGTTLAGALSRMLNVRGKADKALTNLGISATDAQGNFKSFSDILNEFASSNATAGDILTIFGEESGRGILSLVEGIRGGTVDIKNFTSELEKATGTAQEMAGIKEQGFEGQMRTLNSAMENLFITIADTGLLADITKIMAMVTQFIGKVAEVNPVVIKVAVGIGVLVTALGFLLIPLGSLVSIIGTVMSLASAGVFAGLAASIAGWGSAFVAAAGGALAFLAPVLAVVGPIIAIGVALIPVIMFIQQFIAVVQEFGVVDAIFMAVTAVVQAFGQIIVGTLAGAIAAVVGFAGAVVVGIGMAVSAIVGGGLKILAAIASWIEGILGVPPIFSTALNQSAKIVLSFVGKFRDAGGKLMTALADGIKSAIGRVTTTISDAMDTVRSYLPFSDAKKGPLSDLTYSGASIPRTIAEGIEKEAYVFKNSMVNLLTYPFDRHQFFASNLNNSSIVNNDYLTFTNNKFEELVSSNSIVNNNEYLTNNVNSFETQEVQIRELKPLPNQTTISNVSTTPINVTINLNNNSKDKSLIEQLKAEGKTIARIVEDAIAKKERTKYA